MVALISRNRQHGADNERREFGTQSGVFARSLLLATLCRDAADAPFHAQLARLFDLTEYRAAERAGIEQFIHDTFAAAYAADVQGFMPRLLGVRARNGNLLAAFGVRSAEKGGLYLEQYLDQPIEQALAGKAGVTPQRSRIAEVGNLATTHPGAVRWMIVALTVMLYEEGYEWVTFTGTSSLRNGFCNLGLQPQEICPALAERLAPEERMRWGNYYQHKPMVMSGNVREGFQAMRANAQLLDLLSGEKESFFRVLHAGMEIAASGQGK